MVKELALVGGGHSHVVALRQRALRPVPGARLTLISRQAYTLYSGMLPGYVAGHYVLAETRIDLAGLCKQAGVRFIQDEVIGLDGARRILHCRRRAELGYDLLSIDIGATSDAPAAGASRILPLRPMEVFAAAWPGLCARLAHDNTRVGVVGAGAAGIELALAAQYRWQTLAGRAQTPRVGAEVHLFTDGRDILPGHNRAARAQLQRVLAARGVRVYSESRVVDVNATGLVCADGRRVALDATLWAAGPVAHAWPGQSGLQVDRRGFIEVCDTLESVSHPEIFAVGDAACVAGAARPKSGVFAVRQGVTLADNIRRKLLGRALRPCRLPRHSLSLISTGDKYAIATRAGWTLQGRWAWRWKDRIDRRFVGGRRQRS